RHTRFSRDWSSDVCSSDLASRDRLDDRVDLGAAPEQPDEGIPDGRIVDEPVEERGDDQPIPVRRDPSEIRADLSDGAETAQRLRSQERRGGHEHGASTSYD